MSKKSGGGLGFPNWSIVTWILVVTLTSTLIQHLFLNNSITPLVALSKDTLFHGQIWRLFTYQVFHADLLHVLFNMLWLFFLGRMGEAILGSRHFLFIYIAGGVIGGLAHVLWQVVLNDPSGVIGASGAVMAVFTALVTKVPNQPVSFLFIPVPFKMKYLGWGLLALNVLGLLFSFSASGSGDAGVSYVAHLGGMATGWFFAGRTFPAVRIIPDRGPNEPKKPRIRKRKLPRSTDPPREQEPVFLDKQVDAILEKISEEGMQSLTPDERKILKRSSEKLSKKLDDQA